MVQTNDAPDAIPGPGGSGATIRPVGSEQPWTWLAHGWQDLCRAPSVSLAYGIVFSVAGLVLTGAIWLIDAFYLVLPLAAGFLLMGPILSVGLYEVSRRLAAGEAVSLAAALTAEAEREVERLAADVERGHRRHNHRPQLRSLSHQAQVAEVQRRLTNAKH